jgi:flagellar biosynthesis protein FliR
MATIIRLAMLVLAINIGAFDRAIEALVASYQMVPVGGVALNILKDGYHGALEVLLKQAISIATISLSFSASWLAAYLVIDIAMGLLAKVVQGVQFTSTATVLKMVITCVLFINLAANPRELIDLIDDISAAVGIGHSVNNQLFKEPRR